MKIQGFCLYEIFGNYDVLLRTWLNQELAEAFFSYLETELGTSRNRPISFAVRHSYHWATGRGTGIPDTLSELTPARVKRAQEGEKNEIEDLKKDRLVTHYGPVFPRDMVKFFMVISHIDPAQIVIEEDLRKNVLQEIQQFERRSGFPEEARKTSLYIGEGFGWALVKGLAPTIYDVSDLGSSISSHLSHLKMRTTTFLVSKQSAIENDCINESSLSLRGRPSPIMKGWLPGIIGDPKATENWPRVESVAVATYELFEKNAIDAQDRKFIGDLIVSVLREDENTATRDLLFWFHEMEGWLRSNPEKILNVLGYAEPAKTKSSLLTKCGIQDWDVATLGKRLEYYQKAIEPHKELVLLGPAECKRYDSVAEWRNKISHGSLREGRLLRAATPLLEEIVQFLPFYTALRRLVKGRVPNGA